MWFSATSRCFSTTFYILDFSLAWFSTYSKQLSILGYISPFISFFLSHSSVYSKSMQLDRSEPLDYNLLCDEYIIVSRRISKHNTILGNGIWSVGFTIQYCLSRQYDIICEMKILIFSSLSKSRGCLTNTVLIHSFSESLTDGPSRS